MEAALLSGGFSDPSPEAAIAFRALMNAMARPGKIFEFKELESVQPPAPLSKAAGLALLTLTDADTPIYLAPSLDTENLRTWIQFHTGAPFSSPSNCQFALGQWDELMPLDQYAKGTPEYPDRSATLIVEREELNPQGARLSGPGIKDFASFDLPDPAAIKKANAHFPLGLDFYFTSADRIAALPRSTRIG